MSSPLSPALPAGSQGSSDEVTSKEFGAILDAIGRLLGENVLTPDISELRPQIRDTLSTIDSATDTILSEVEKIQAADLNNPDATNHIKSSCMAILEACSFHDLCSQRLTKVDGTIDRLTHGAKAVQDLVGGNISSSEHILMDGEVPPPAEDDPEAGLLNGPALDGEGVDQDDIDRLFDFD